MTRARRARARYIVGSSAAAVLVVAAGVSAAVLFGSGDPEPRRFPPAATPSASPEPSEPATVPTPPQEQCSARETVPPVEDRGGAFPQAVEDTRKEIAELAAACDFEGLEDVADRSEFFTYSYGDGGAAARHWRKVDEDERVMATLIEILQMSHAVQDGSSAGGEVIYVWPAVAGSQEPSEAEWDEVRSLYSAEEIDRMKEFGGYLGYRAGITEDGDWIFFVAGD